MGRVRRNQRDAIRKQRAKKRNKQSGGNDRDSDYDQGEVANPKRRWIGDNPSGSEKICPDSGVESREIKPSVSYSNCATAQAAKIEQSVENDRDDSKSKGKASLDRIERMRLKKQEQKIRNKEKKAARAAEAAARFASLKKDK